MTNKFLMNCKWLQGTKIVKRFAFFGGKVSPKFGKPCCKYGQDGKPLPVDKVLANYEQVKEFLDGWSFNENHTALQKFIYLEDFYQVPALIKKIIDIDQMDTQNKPNIQLINGDLLKIELKSHNVGGLSHVDFELAILLNAIDLGFFSGLVVKSDKGYRREVREIKNRIESEKIEQMLKETMNANTASRY